MNINTTGTVYKPEFHGLLPLPKIIYQMKMPNLKIGSSSFIHFEKI